MRVLNQNKRDTTMEDDRTAHKKITVSQLVLEQ
jgi:hypothetical protein